MFNGDATAMPFADEQFAARTAPKIHPDPSNGSAPSITLRSQSPLPPEIDLFVRYRKDCVPAVTQDSNQESSFSCYSSVHSYPGGLRISSASLPALFPLLPVAPFSCDLQADVLGGQSGLQ